MTAGRDSVRWGTSFALVLAAHAGAVAGVLVWSAHGVPAAPPPAALVMDLAPMVQAPEAPPQDLPPAPQAVEPEPPPPEPEPEPEEVVEDIPEPPPQPDPPAAGRGSGGLHAGPPGGCPGRGPARVLGACAA